MVATVLLVLSLDQQQYLWIAIRTENTIVHMPDQQAKLPASAHIGRVTLRVDDLDRIVAWYETVIGLTVHHRSDDQAVLGTGSEPLLVVVAAPDIPSRDRNEAGLFHTAFRVPSRTALADALGRIRQQGDLEGASDHLLSEALYLTDPEGNGVEVYCDREREEWPNSDTNGSVGMDTLPLDTTSLPDRSHPEPSVPAGTTVGHVHLESTALGAARAFYVDDLGLRVRDRFGESALFVAAGNYHHHVGLNVWNDRTEPHTGQGLHRFEIVVPDDQTLDAVRSRLEESGRRFTATQEGIEVSDPDGIDLRVITE